MAGVAGKRPKTVLVNKDAVDQAGTFLEALSEKPKEEFSLRAAANRLREPIRAALAKGYSYEEVAELLGEQGITISASTLKNYVPSGTRQSKNGGSATTKERKARKNEETATPTELAVEPSKPAPETESRNDVVPLAAKTETPKATAAKSTTSKSRTTAAKTTPTAKTRTAAKTKSSDSKPTTTTKTTRKPAATSSRSKTTKKR